MEKRFDKIDKSIENLKNEVISLAQIVGVTSKAVDDLTAAVAQGFVHMEATMATKVELGALEKKVDTGFEGVNGKIEGVHRRMDAELEQKRVLEDRVSKIEVVVFPALAK